MSKKLNLNFDHMSVFALLLTITGEKFSDVRISTSKENAFYKGSEFIGLGGMLHVDVQPDDSIKITAPGPTLPIRKMIDFKDVNISLVVVQIGGPVYGQLTCKEIFIDKKFQILELGEKIIMRGHINA